MKYYIATAVLMMLIPLSLLMAQDMPTLRGPGTFSLGTRNTFSVFNDDHSAGKGIGGQVRVQFSDRINSEWFFDYITSKHHDETARNDYHVGWSLMYYPGNIHFKKVLQPYVIAGHCFDYSKVFEQKDPANYADRWSMAAQAGLGTHFNISPRFDCSLTTQYMLHFGKEIEATVDKEIVLIEKKTYSSVHGHVLVSISFNYKLFPLW